MRNVKCTCCGGKMGFMMQKKFQKGDMGIFVGDIDFSMQGGFEMAVYSCPGCGKLEFFLPDEDKDLYAAEENEDLFAAEEYEVIPPEIGQDIVGVSMDGVPQVRCPKCGKRHDFDYPRCPRCDYEY